MELKLLKRNCTYHLHQQYVALCMNQQCQYLKLCCGKCLVFFHSSHSNSILFLDDLFNSRNKLLKAWNCPKSIQSIIKYKQQAQLFEGQLTELQNQLEKNIYQQIDRTKKKLRKQRIQIRSQIQKKIQNLKYQNRIGFQISHIQNIIKLFLKNKINLFQYQEEIDKIIKNRQDMQSLLQQKVKIPSIDLDVTLFEDKQQILIAKLKQINKIIKIPQRKFQFTTASNLISKYIKEIEKGKIFQFSQEYDYQIIYGPILKNQNTIFSVKIEVIKQEFQQSSQKKIKKRAKKMQIENQDQQSQQQIQIPQEAPPNTANNNAAMQNYIDNRPRFAQRIPNFNRDHYKKLKNLFVGLINDESKNDQKSYKPEAVRPVKYSQFINHGYDIIQGTTIGGLLYSNQYSLNGPYTKNMPTVFYEKINSQDFELHFNWNGFSKFLSIEQKDRQAKLDCSLYNNKNILPMMEQQQCINLIQLRPYICCNKSKVRVTIQEKELKNFERTNSNMQF